jgi:uncharacterized membrane protein YozB (DUF420 family)
MVESLLASFGLTASDLPAVNAALNGLAGALLVAGYLAIKARRITPHKWCMVAAFAVSVVFLASYLYYHIVVKRGEPTRFTAGGWPRYLYFAILTSHTILAVAVAVLAPVTLWLGFGAPGNRHLRLARWTFPIWLYVSVTGVVVYLMLYQMFPPA